VEDYLNSYGFCCLVQRFERSASVCQSSEIPNLTPDQVVQYTADNVDHNKITIDGWNTFQGMQQSHQRPRAVTTFLASQYQQKTYAPLDMLK